MSYHVCYPEDAYARMIQRAAGPVRFLETLFGPYSRVPIDPTYGIFVVDPRFYGQRVRVPSERLRALREGE